MGGSTTAPSWNTSSHRKNGNFQAALVPYQAEKRWKDQSWWMKKWEVGSRLWYCWWKKSQTTTLDVQNPVNNGINYDKLPTSDWLAGFFPSTVAFSDLPCPEPPTYSVENHDHQSFTANPIKDPRCCLCGSGDPMGGPCCDVKIPELHRPRDSGATKMSRHTVDGRNPANQLIW